MYTKLGGRAPSFCAMAQLLPSAEELSGFDTIDAIVKWSGMPCPAPASFSAVLGRLANLLFAGIPINVFKTMVEGWRVPTATAVLSIAVGAVAKGPSISSGRPAAPTEISCAFLAFQAARLKMGLTFEIDSPPVSAVLTTGVSAPAVPTVKPRTVKMNAVIDQTDETEVPVKTPATMKALSEIYIKKEGGEPDAEEDPTAEQVSCVDQLLQHDLPPTPDNAIFGPYGAAVHRKLKFKGQVFVNGELVTSEISGPPNCFVWKACMAVLRTIFIMLQVGEPKRFDAYIKHIEGLNNTYGNKAWAILYQADIEMRTQEFARIKSRLERKHARNAAFRAICATAVGANVQGPVDPDEFDTAKT